MARIARAGVILLLVSGSAMAQTSLESLARPIDGRSMRATSSFRKGADGKYDPNADPLANDEEKSNFDNRRVMPGETMLLLDAEGPGVITHLWFTFAGPAPRRGNNPGSASHQDFLLRITWDDAEHPGVEAPLGDFFRCSGIDVVAPDQILPNTGPTRA